MAETILQPYNGQFTSRLESFRSSRIPISDRMYRLLHGLVVLLTTCSISIAGAYAWGLGEGTSQSLILGATAVGLEVSLVFFAATMYPRLVMWLFGLIAGLGVLLVSVLTITSFLISQQHQQEHHAIQERESYRVKLVRDRERLDIRNPNDRATIGILSNRIEAADKELATLKAATPETKSTAVYHYLAEATGSPVEVISLLLRGAYGLVVVCTTVALAGYLETVYSPNSLTQWLHSLEYQEATIQSARERFAAIGEHQKSKVPSLTFMAPVVPPEKANASRHRRTRGGAEVGGRVYQKVLALVDSLEPGAPIPIRRIRGVTKQQDVAYGAMDRMIAEGIVEQQKNGRYTKKSLPGE